MADAVESRAATDGDDDRDDRRAARGQQGAAAQNISADMAQEKILLRERNNQDGNFFGRGSWGSL